MTRHVISMLIVTVIGLAILSETNAATIQAANCSQSSTQSAINSASTGDTVSIPAGNCTWTSTVTIPSSKRIALMGAGTDVTVITFSPAGRTALNLSRSGSRLSGFTFREGAILVDGSNWRVDHCKLEFSSWSDGVNAGSINTINGYHPTGVVDHCIFNNSRVLVIGTNYGLEENGTQHYHWSRPPGLGSNNAVFVENCTFNGVADSVNAIDANYGGRFVFRCNTLNDFYVEAHSVQGNNRATRSWEIYNNTFNQVNKAMWVPMFLRGGTGVVFNNTLTGTWNTAGIALDNVRDCETRSVSGRCDGSSPWDGNQAGQGGYPCRDQIGRSTDSFLWTASTPYPPQALDPAYAWSNKHGANDVLFFQHNNCANHIQAGRDYFNNTTRPGYTPYTYPHPLVQGGTPSTLAPPENLHVLGWAP